MSRSDFYRSPLLPKKLTDHITILFFAYFFIVAILPIILPRSGYPDGIILIAKDFASYIPSIAVFSHSSFAPELSLVVGMLSWIWIIFVSLLVIIMNLSGCNTKTCLELNKKFPELISGMEIQRMIYVGLVLLGFFTLAVLPNFSWFPRLFFGIVSGRGLSLYSLLHHHGGINDRANDIFILAYYSRFGLIEAYEFIALVVISLSYLITAFIRTSVCKWLVHVNSQS